MNKSKVCSIIADGIEHFLENIDKNCDDAKYPTICIASKLVKDPYFTRWTKIYNNLGCKD